MDAIVVALAVACAWARAEPWVAFPTVIHEGKGPVFLHLPVLGLGLAAVCGWRRPLRALLLFGAIHLAAVLVFEWHQDIYTTVLGGPITPHVYLVLGNLYIIAVVAGLSIAALLMMTGRRITLPALPDSVIVIALFVLSFLARWSWGRHVLASTGSNYLAASDDGLAYHEMARRIVSGIRLTPTDFYAWGGTLYWYFLAAIYRMAGFGNFPVVIAVQAALGAAVSLAIYWIARSLTGSKGIAAVAAVLCGLNKILIFTAGVIGMEALYIPLFYVGLAWVISQPRSSSAYLGIGLVFALANLARNEIFGYPFFLLLAAVLLLRRDRFMIRGLALVCLGFMLAWIVQACVSYYLYGRFTLQSSQALAAFAIEKFGIRENVILDRMGFNPFYDLPQALRVWIAYPGTVTALLATGFVKRLLMFLLMPGDGLFDPLTLTSSDFIHNHFPAIRVSFPALIDSYALLFCAIGLIVLRLRALPLQMFVIYIAAVNAVLIAKSPRHRAILIPIFLFAVVQGVTWLLQQAGQLRKDSLHEGDAVPVRSDAVPT